MAPFLPNPKVKLVDVRVCSFPRPRLHPTSLPPVPETPVPRDVPKASIGATRKRKKLGSQGRHCNSTLTPAQDGDLTVCLNHFVLDAVCKMATC